MAGMIVGQFVHADLDLSGASTFLNLYTAAGNQYATKRFLQPVDTEEALVKIQEPVIAIRRKLRKDKQLEGAISALFEQIADGEKSVDEIINFHNVDPRILELTDQVFWKAGAMGCFLNGWGFLIEAILFWKTILMPGFAVLMPFLVIVLPFILLRTMFQMPITVSDYVKIIHRLALSNTPLGADTSTFGSLAKYAYLLMSVGVFISNIWNQIQSAIHLRSVAEDIRSNGGKIIQYVVKCKELATLLGDQVGVATAAAVEFDEDILNLGAYGMMYNNSKALARLRDWVSEVDLEVGIARLKGICFPKVFTPTVKTEPKVFTPTVAAGQSGQTRQSKAVEFHLEINSLYHPGVPAGRRIMNSVSMVPGSNNMLVTGPNRGGKSTLCKSVGFAIMTAQSWGFAWAKSMEFVPVSRFETALAPADTLGRLSLFEAEIEFAKHLLVAATAAAADSVDAGPCAIIMDEIFHSTNAHDGAEASLIFLKQLYEKGGSSIGSIISTHYRELPDKLQDKAKTYCMEAYDQGADGIKYTYRCVPGISTISSVREILKERGLLSVENSVQ
jgi:hypothetical protein